MKRANPSAGTYETVALEKGDLILSVPATGVIEARFSVEIKSKASGEINKVFKEEGDLIARGDPLVDIDPRIEEIGVRRAKADLMAGEAKVKKEEILLTKAKLAKKRTEKLYKKGFISDEEREEAAHALALQSTDLTLSQAALIRTRETLLEAEERLKETRVASPLSGVIFNLHVKEGQIISSGTSSFSQGTPLAVVGDLSNLQIRADVDETDVRMVSVNQEALVRLDAFPDRTYRARVVRVAPMARMKNDLAVVEVLLALEGSSEDLGDSGNPESRSHQKAPTVSLRPGLSADVEIVTKHLSSIYLLDREAVHQQEGKWGISVLDGESLTFHEVKIGATDGERLEVQTDLPVGTQVVLNANAEASTEQSVGGRP